MICRHRGSVRATFALVLMMLTTCNEARLGISSSSLDVKSVEAVEEFTPEVSANKMLDILLVIDNSGSMKYIQQNLSTKLDPLLGSVADSDWQIAITTTDSRDCIAKIIMHENRDEFVDVVSNLGIEGTGLEQAILMAIRALKGQCIRDDNGGIAGTMFASKLSYYKKITGNRSPTIDKLIKFAFPADFDTRDVSRCEEKKSWLREDSTLAVLIVSDEDHLCGKYYGCSLTDFYFFINSIRKLHATANIYGLLDLNPPAPDQKNNYGSIEYKKWKDEDNESIFAHIASVHAEDFTDTLQEISKTISASMESEFILKHSYDGQDVEIIIYHGGEQKTLKEDDYLIEGKTLTLITTPPANTERIEVKYSYNPDIS